MAVFLQTCNLSASLLHIYIICNIYYIDWPSPFLRRLSFGPGARSPETSCGWPDYCSSCGGVVDGRTPAPFGIMCHKLSSCRKDVKEGFFHQVLSFPIVFGQSISTLVQLLAAFANQVQQQIQELATVPLVNRVL